MSTTRRRGSHAHDSGSAGRESGGRPKGTVSDGLLRSPFEAVACPAELVEGGWADGFDWYSFICSYCAEEVNLSREFTQPLDDFWLMCSWLYGDPPICTNCLLAARGIHEWD